MKAVLKIAYDGGAFSGFQRQPHITTVQGKLESALSQILSDPVSLQAAGRTDVGVHATGQVVAFPLEKTVDIRRLCRSANSLIGESIAVSEGVLLDDDDPFHPRYSAQSRTYSYAILQSCTPQQSCFWKDRAWCLPSSLDLEAMNEASTLFLGEIDFSTFSYKMEKMETRVRHVSNLSLQAEPAPWLISPQPGPRLIRLSITANGFLRRMVRLIAAGVVEVGLGRRSLQDLRARLECLDPTKAPHPAPPHGLYLESIDYDPDPFLRYQDSSHHAYALLPNTHRFKA